MENSNPPMAPAAKANQNTSFWPPQRKGTNPSKVDIMVNKIGIIL